MGQLLGGTPLTAKTNNERYQKRLRIGVRVEESGFVLLDGKPLPQLHRGSVGEIVFAPECFVSEKIRTGLAGETRVPLLAKKTLIMMGMSPSVIGDAARKGLIHADSLRIFSEDMFIEVILEEDQLLQIRGDQVAKLAPCPCFIPALDQKARSLNHAFTLISEAYETLRRSHSGNAFLKAYAKGDSGRWVSLDEFRLHAIQRVASGSKGSSS